MILVGTGPYKLMFPFSLYHYDLNLKNEERCNDDVMVLSELKNFFSFHVL